MRVLINDAAVGDGPGAALDPVSLEYAAGAASLVATEGGQRPTVLSLVAAGRMTPTAGSVEPAGLHRRVALVDTPNVAEHSADQRLDHVVGEELALASRPHGRRAVHAMLAEHDLLERRRAPFGSLPAADRIRLLLSLTATRPGVEGIVLTSPERHGGAPADWWRLARATAASGIAVLVVTDAASVDAIARLPHSEPSRPDDVALFESSWS